MAFKLRGLWLLAVLAASPAWPVDKPSLAKPFVEAGKDFQKGRFAEAARFYREIMVTYEGSDWEAKAALFLGQCQEGMGKRRDAKETYRKLAEKHPEMDEGVEAVFRLAGLAEAAGDSVEAEKWYGQLLASPGQGKGGALAELNLANLQARARQTKEALKTFSRLASDFPGNAWAVREAQLGRAKILRQEKDFPQAISVYQALADNLPAGPAKAQALMSLGHCALEARDNTRAAQAYQKVGAEYPDWQAVSLFYLGQAQMQAGWKSEALQTFERLDIKHPKTIWGKAARNRLQEISPGEESSQPQSVPGEAQP